MGRRFAATLNCALKALPFGKRPRFGSPTTIPENREEFKKGNGSARCALTRSRAQLRCSGSIEAGLMLMQFAVPIATPRRTASPKLQPPGKAPSAR